MNNELTEEKKDLRKSFFKGIETRLGVVSHPKLNGGKRNSFIEVFLGILKEVFEKDGDEILTYLCCNNPIGFDYYLKSNWRRMGINNPIIIDWNTHTHKEGKFDRVEMKKMMYMNLVKHSDKVLYLTHSNSEENKFGYVIQQRCFKENKDFIEVELIEDLKKNHLKLLLKELSGVLTKLKE